LKQKLYLCIHGHFYQPPRENPWTGEIELQHTAAPFHDWNERIFQECYKPNTEAIIADLTTNRILEKINNFEYINFNFGPTLLYWIKEKHPDILEKIIEADKKSVIVHNGHGNAIAQVYNHIIMPLANERDNITQIKWGLYDFEFHFGRKSEGIWLAETACNNDTIEYLIEEGIKFIILDPSQALKIRKIKNGDWENVSSGNINTKHPYRAFSRMDSDKFIDIFFYDGPLSKNIAFDDIIYNAERLMERIDSAKDSDLKKPQLIHMAVDGETFGHHKHFTERTIAYLLSKLAPEKDYTVVNYSEYLSLFQPEYEVQIKPGVNNEGTSWSCIHGVGRWERNCGCHTGGEPGWNQEWRRPLRTALNRLRDKLSEIFELEGKKYFIDIWEARNDYIRVMLDSSLVNTKEFLKNNAIKNLNLKESQEAIKLLEIQKYSLLMFTSCGWFFSDISGIETVQILTYAKRAIEILKEQCNVNLEEDFLKELYKAKSNKAEFSDGAEIYKQIIPIKNIGMQRTHK
jgi:alpha-amylase/alpha-mannosidase (GH57 family)